MSMLHEIADEILQEVDRDARMKTIVKVAAAEPVTELGVLLRKAAEAVRSDEDEITYNDLYHFIGSRP